MAQWLDAEARRLDEDARRLNNWKRWGPYLSERQWATVREHYSPDQTCWESFTYEHSLARAYRWGEDGLLGMTDRECRLCFALALWNGRDPHLKERLFGLTNPEGNHSEDVKEVYFYLDATPTYSYFKALYKYPQTAFPYDGLRAENLRRGRREPEYELTDTGAFDGDRYWDVTAEYAKASPDDILIRVTIANRGAAHARLHLLPTLWFRNTWSWGAAYDEGRWPKPGLTRDDDRTVMAVHATLGRFRLTAGDGPDGRLPELLFTENETNARRLFDSPNESPYVKDAFHDYIVHGRQGSVRRDGGTKAAALYVIDLPAAGECSVHLRLTKVDDAHAEAFRGFEQVFADRRSEADAFYAANIPPNLPAIEQAISRQAYAGLLWSEQFYYYVVPDWITGDAKLPLPPDVRARRINRDWEHLFSRDVLSVPDKWEYPAFFAWDLAFHMIPMARIDADNARRQLLLLLREWYLHPNGQLPAYEYDFSNVNPPVHAWACWHVFQRTGSTDHVFLERAFHKLLMNFTWWVNREDPEGRNVFSGGFLGMDNLGVFDRSRPLPTGGRLDQADGTAWMGFYCTSMLRIALELALHHNRAYEDVASKFLEHFFFIADSLNNLGGRGLWDEADGFYYDQLLVDGMSTPLKLRALIGLIPLLAVQVLDEEVIWPALPEFAKRAEWFLANRKDLIKQVADIEIRGDAPYRHWLLSLPGRKRLERALGYLLDEREFLSPYGVRSLSRIYKDHPYVFRTDGDGREYQVAYVPGDMDSAQFGGNSNWRGPVWFPINFLLIEALREYHDYYGDTFRIECPTGSGRLVDLDGVAQELAERLITLFVPEEGRPRPCHGSCGRYADDPHWRDYVLFYEYFDGDTGRGLGASHQTGWTALITSLFDYCCPRRDWLDRAHHLPLRLLLPQARSARDNSTRELPCVDRRCDMTGWPGHPLLYEINTWPWVRELSAAAGQHITLANVPQPELERIAALGFDGVWLMGVWERSPRSREIAASIPDLLSEYRRALPDLTRDDVVGSPYAVYRYEVDDALGGREELTVLRERLRQRGVRLVLDFVPNHVAIDHPWLVEYPNLFVQATAERLTNEPHNYFTREIDGVPRVFAHGRDPYYNGWTDTAQLDYRSRDTRRALGEVLARIAGQCDGVRCDMAMLVIRDVFVRTWGRDFDPPDADFWTEAIGAVKAKHPGFLFMGEVYWDLEYRLQQLGFDYTYDKRLYDRLVGDDAGSLRAHLGAGFGFQRRLTRFVENHDEPRAAAAFGPERCRAAAVLALTLPGMRLVHEGQIEGRRVKIPVQLGRRPPEPAEALTRALHERLLRTLSDPVFHVGRWQLLEPQPAGPSEAYCGFIAHHWSSPDALRLVIVNWSAQQAQCFLPLGLPMLAGCSWQLPDLLGAAVYQRAGDELLNPGLYVDMPAYAYHLFAFQRF